MYMLLHSHVDIPLWNVQYFIYSPAQLAWTKPVSRARKVSSTRICERWIANHMLINSHVDIPPWNVQFSIYSPARLAWTMPVSRAQKVSSTLICGRWIIRTYRSRSLLPYSSAQWTLGNICTGMSACDFEREQCEQDYFLAGRENYGYNNTDIRGIIVIKNCWKWVPFLYCQVKFRHFLYSVASKQGSLKTVKWHARTSRGLMWHTSTTSPGNYMSSL